MRRLMVLSTLLFAAAAASAEVLDDFTRVDDWVAAPSDAVELRIGTDAGPAGTAMRLDFDFHGGAGYAIARKPVKMTLPEDYEFTFSLRGETPPNTLEFKLLDATGENVWWLNQRNREFPRDWTRMRIKKRHLEFAWGPSGGKPLTEISAIEIVITASTGGRGTVWIDELAFHERAPRPATYPAVKRSTRPGSVTLDFGVAREFGGLTLEWAEGKHASSYDVEVSDDAKTWETVARVSGSNGGRDPLFLPDSDARYVRVRFSRGTLQDIRVEPLEFSSSRNAFFTRIAAGARRGLYARYFENVQSYWTVVGETKEEREALINEDGAIEVDRSSFSVEPFVFTNGRLIAWSDAERTQSLAAGYAPIPSVDWHSADVRLTVTAFARANVIYARYRVANPASERRDFTLFLALRPFQVNPPWQFLNVPGGMAEIHELAYDGESTVRADGRRVVSLTRPAAFGATPFAAGDITESLVRGTLPETPRVRDEFGAASGALRYDLTLEPNAHRDLYIALPAGDGDVAEDPERQLADATREWIDRLSRFTLELPGAQGEQVARVLKSNVAYVLINQDGGAIQPGSRSYDRSWIRDGSLTSEALLRLGYTEAVRDFVEWFAPYQFPSGKVPCCVDARGADPVPEHDSHGELIFLIAEYYRHTHDREALVRLWPHVQKAVSYIESLTRERMTPEYQTPEKRAFYGMVPESISHEGYSAKPMHSYWDTLFVLRGLEDAAFLAEVLGAEERAAYARFRDTFRTNLLASIEETRRVHGIDYIPGSVELGDFDATSTTIALSPVRASLDRDALHATFERYYAESMKRIGSTSWEGYTPYETRTIGSFVRLGWRDRAQQMLAFFLGDLRPAAWNQWAEVVYRDPATPKFIGDMPHTWVGSDFIRSVLDMFAYEEDENTLVVGAGVPREWTRGTGVVLRGLRTQRGIVDLTMREVDGVVQVQVGGSANYPRVVVKAP